MAKKYKLRQEAIKDLKEIGRYTLKKHGKNQRDKYLQGINNRFKSLGNTPLIGLQRNEIKEGYYSSNYEKHVIFYLVHESYIDVISVLHQSMDIQRHI